MRVVVPLGNKSLRIGVIIRLESEDAKIARQIYKMVLMPLERQAILDLETLRMIDGLSARLGTRPGFILGHVLPAGLRTSSMTIEWDNAKFPLSDIKKLSPAEAKCFARDFMAGKVKIGRNARDDQQVYALCCELPWPVRPAAKRQKKLLDFLYQHGCASRKKLSLVFGSDIFAVIKKLLQAGLINETTEEFPEEMLEAPSETVSLNQFQRNCLENIREALSGGCAAFRLLYGITGSGKTAVYQEAAKFCLSRNKSVFALAPEVALAQKLYLDFQAALPNAEIIFYHGYQTAAQKEKIWQRIGGLTQAAIVVGTRSALFLPLKNVACVILDEEHDSSYKQDEIFAYNAKEIAWFRMVRARGLLLLGSATPDIRTFHASEQGLLERLEMPARIGGRPLPPVQIVDISKNPVMGTEQELLSDISKNALKECLSNDEQAVILLNRRGYAPMIFCVDCAKTIRCPNCSIGLAYHKNIGRLLCHYCGFSIPYPSPCPDCGHSHFISIGEGTERLTEHLEKLAGLPVLRMDRDNTRSPGKMQDILTAFSRKASPFLAGTQMLSKGHHFPNVTLSIVADADIGLNLPDYRAAEKTFQLLVQAAGRAGRGEKPGKVIIQTRNAAHYCWRYIANYDYRGFYEEEMRRRKKLAYPPFGKLGLIRISHALHQANGPELVRELGYCLKDFAKNTRTKLLGPTPAPISLLRGRKRFHCLLKGESWEDMRKIYFFGLAQRCAAELRLFLDLDPVNML